MKSRKIIWFVGALSLLLIYFVWDSYSQPNIKDVPGDFEEVAFVRNEQNKGGIVRIYAVTVGDPTQAQYEQCADLFPTNDYGSVTKIYFFDKNGSYPTELTLEEPHFETGKYSVLRIIKRYGSN
ncbi:MULTISPECIES: hypothetical protein [Sphingobacterium]|uniref:Uncharacterized protein n=1 Tax=Sphingobacterium populi TaxID=1812824 RepID=A0ABW5UIF5_9SPHI|nr:hypothetical protein [Sphingobacterium sp. CFCC 11742]